MIKFLCPNGHQLTAPDHLAGKSGKCPKCSTAFVVPTLEELALGEEPAGDEAAPAPKANEADRLPPGMGSPDAAPEGAPSEVGAAAKPEGAKSGIGGSGVVSGSKIGTESTKGTGKPGAGIFVFLCPNGHKLNGPPSLKGKAGQCPHCGARFMIPEDDVPEEDIPTGSVDDDDVPSGESVEDEIPAGEEVPDDVVEADVEEMEPDPEPIPPGVHSLGYIVGRLWDHKSESTELEIFLQEGEIISPDHYAEILSTGEYGVFAHQESEDNFSLSVIPWSAVRRVDLRRVAKLANGMFR